MARWTRPAEAVRAWTSRRTPKEKPFELNTLGALALAKALERATETLLGRPPSARTPDSSIVMFATPKGSSSYSPLWRLMV